MHKKNTHHGIFHIRSANAVYLHKHKQNVQTNQMTVCPQDKSVWTSSEGNTELHKEVIILVFPHGTHN